MSDRFEKMERCTSAPLAMLIEFTRDADWYVRYAAVVALGERADAAAIAPLLDVLRAEDAAPLYSQTTNTGGTWAGATRSQPAVFPAGTTEEMKLAWQRRGRIKQAACLALGSIGVANATVLKFLHRYAVDQSEDAAVRAAACQAVRLIGAADSRSVLAIATLDPEWCTATEARKGL